MKSVLLPSPMLVAAAAAAVAFSTAAPDAAAQTTVKISGGVRNTSAWRNDPAWTPPHFYVDGEFAEPTHQQGRVLLALHFGDGIDEYPIATVYLAPTNIFDLVSLPQGVGNWLFEFPEVTKGLTYTLAAWIDGNDNRVYDVGEPVGTRRVIPQGDSIGNIVTIRDDSDGDGLEDWWEMHWFGSLNQYAGTDYDNDGLTNLEERNLVNGSYPDLQPNNWDSDGDGMDDGWELSYGLDPTSSTGADGATGDPDGDTLNNLFEYKGPDGVGPKARDWGGIARDTGSQDTMNPQSQDTDDDGVHDNVEVLSDLTHPSHSMSSTNYAQRSLGMAVNGGAGIALTDPEGGLFAFRDGAGTVEFWIRAASNTTDGRIYWFPTAGAGDDHFRISLVARRPKMEILTGSTVFAFVGGAEDAVEQLPVDRWTHVAFVWEPANNSLSLYVNGVLYVARKTFVKPDFVKGPPAICTGFTSGHLDELRVWNYARTASDIDFWARRIFPAPGYVQIAARTAGGFIIPNYNYGQPLVGYYRFDDAGETVENYAFLNNADYALGAAAAAAVTDEQAASVFGSDDADFDGVPEWWASLHNLEQYPEYYSTMVGPTHVPCPEDNMLLLGFDYSRSFVAYASVGNGKSWVEDDTDPEAVYRSPKTWMDFYEGKHSSYMKYVYLQSQPLECKLELFTPGMESTIAYVNGTLVTPVGTEANTLQSIDVAPYLKLGRNMVYVRCTSIIEKTAEPATVMRFLGYDGYQAYLDSDPTIPSWLNCERKPYRFDTAVGKFDARLTCNGEAVIIRGDESRADPRAVWHCQVWSELAQERSDYPLPDQELRYLPGNQDYGVPDNAERDNNPQDPDLADDRLDAFYEYICGTNPRDRDTNNNGIPDGAEDFDDDGLVNSVEQSFGSSPWLPDTDDDGTVDGADTGSNGHPAQSLSPARNASICFGGTSGDYLELPTQNRFALAKWTLEAWVMPDASESDGGIIVQRKVDPSAVNYELGLGDGFVADINTPYVRFVPNFGGAPVVLQASSGPVPAATWTHLAASYYNGDLKIYVGGTNVGMRTASTTPAIYGCGPIVQRVGQGFNGCIDDLRIWATPRSAADLIGNRDDVLTGIESSLVAYYRFDDQTSFTNGSPVIGTSANTGVNGSGAGVPWTWGQVEDNRLRFAADWSVEWMHAASMLGSVLFSTNAAVVGPPQLMVLIEPDEAVAAEAKWSHNDGASWNVSGFIETRLTPGEYTISASALDGWLAPGVTNITLQRGVLTVITNRYVEAASLSVRIVNDEADVVAAARWSIDNGLTWLRSGETVTGLSPQTRYYIMFRDISSTVPGFSVPDMIAVVLDEGEVHRESAKYAAILGSVQITLGPTNKVPEARWLIVGSTNWNVSGQTVSNLSYGTHTVYYSDVAGYQAPPTEDVMVSNRTLKILARTYTRIPEPTSIRVDIVPDGALAAGAQWRIGTGDWFASGHVELVTAGNYTIDFKDVTDWYKPAAMTVSVTNEYQTRVTAKYAELTILGGYGTALGQFKYPRGLAAANGKLYVTDSGNHRVQVLDLATDTWTAYGGTTAGTGLGQFNQPYGLAIDTDHNIWVADSGNYRIQRRLASTGTWQAWGNQGSGLGQFNVPYDLALDSAGSVYIADHHNSRIQRLTLPNTWTNFIPNGPPTPAVRFPMGIALDSANRVFVSDYDAAMNVHRVRVFNSAGETLTDVGTASAAKGGLNIPTGLAFGTNGHLFVVSKGINVLHEADVTSLSLPVWSVRLGAGVLNKPHDVAMDGEGNLYIADTENHRIVMLPSEDADGDHSPNYQEELAGTNPLDKDSTFIIKPWQSVDGSGARIVSWSSQAGRLYTVLISTDMSAGWSATSFVNVPGTGAEMRYTNTAPMTGTEYYRVLVRVAP